jgi:hypothetical protein
MVDESKMQRLAVWEDDKWLPGIRSGVVGTNHPKVPVNVCDRLTPDLQPGHTATGGGAAIGLPVNSPQETGGGRVAVLVNDSFQWYAAVGYFVLGRSRGGDISPDAILQAKDISARPILLYGTRDARRNRLPAVSLTAYIRYSPVP